MKKNILTLLLALTFGFMGVHANAQKDPMVGGAAMYPTKNIVENAINSKDHTTLVAAVKAAGLVDTLEGRGRSPSSLQPTKPLPRYPRGPSIRC